MNVRTEIAKYASDEDKSVLEWLFNKYHWSSQWDFVASCTFKRYGPMSYELHRVWHPTEEGRILHANRYAKYEYTNAI